jgi:dihydroneopterin aldolase
VRTTIFVKDIHLRCIIGVRPRERTRAQPVRISVSLSVDFPSPAAADAIEETVDYSALHTRIVALAEGSSFGLIETLAHRVADLCLADPRASSVEVTVEKPRALRGRALAGVTVVRERPLIGRENAEHGA